MRKPGECLTVSHPERQASPLGGRSMGRIWGGFLKLYHFGRLPPRQPGYAKKKKNCKPGFKTVTWVRIRLVVDPEANSNDLGVPRLFHLPVVDRLSACASSPPSPSAEHRPLAKPSVPHAPCRAPPRLLPASACRRAQTTSPL